MAIKHMHIGRTATSPEVVLDLDRGTIDVTGRSLLAHAAYRMGEIAVANILDTEAFRRGEIMRWNTIPWAVYSNPEAAGIGLTEAQAKAKGFDGGKPAGKPFKKK